MRKISSCIVLLISIGASCNTLPVMGALSPRSLSMQTRRLYDFTKNPHISSLLQSSKFSRYICQRACENPKTTCKTTTYCTIYGCNKEQSCPFLITTHPFLARSLLLKEKTNPLAETAARTQVQPHSSCSYSAHADED